MIIGITGYYASGKDTIAKELEKRGFAHHSLSNIIRSVLLDNKLQLTRENMIYAGNELRKNYGANILKLANMSRPTCLPRGHGAIGRGVAAATIPAPTAAVPLTSPPAPAVPQLR